MPVVVAAADPMVAVACAWGRAAAGRWAPVEAVALVAKVALVAVFWAQRHVCGWERETALAASPAQSARP
jgi:hypothetical protein